MVLFRLQAKKYYTPVKFSNQFTLFTQPGKSAIITVCREYGVHLGYYFSSLFSQPHFFFPQVKFLQTVALMLSVAVGINVWVCQKIVTDVAIPVTVSPIMKPVVGVLAVLSVDAATVV